jgi:hypothetical protein
VLAQQHISPLFIPHERVVRPSFKTLRYWRSVSGGGRNPLPMEVSFIIDGQMKGEAMYRGQISIVKIQNNKTFNERFFLFHDTLKSRVKKEVWNLWIYS